MSKLLSIMLTIALGLNSSWVLAMDHTNTEDAQKGLVQDDPPSTSTGNTGSGNKKANKSINYKSGKNASNMDYKMMDANSDGTISRDEYMNHHEMAYGKMKQTNGGVSMKEMNAQMNVGTTKGNKLQPSNTKDVAPMSSNEATRN